MPWSWLAALGAVVVALLILGTLLTPRRRAVGRNWWTQRSGALLSVLVAGFLTTAVWGPALRTPPQPDRAHLAVVFDLSGSALRARGGWPQARDDVAHVLDAQVAALSVRQRAQTTGSIIGFANTATGLGHAMPVTGLPDAVRRLVPEDITAQSRNLGDGTNIADGLRTAGAAIAAAGGRGVVLLVSDGLQTTGDAQAAAADLARQGIPVFVYPLVSQGSELALASADLPRLIYEGQRTYVRGELWNGRATAAHVNLAIALNHALQGQSPRVGGMAQLQTAVGVSLQPHSYGNLRAPVVFAGYGLQYADLTASFDGARGEQRQRFFTQVKRPLRLLSLGDDRAWEGAFPPSVATITEVAPGHLAAAGDLRRYDVIVISGVVAGSFASAELQTIATAVTHQGVGLMVMNGRQAPGSSTRLSVLKTYDGTPLAPLLPVVSGPRAANVAAAPRHVIFVVDTSGSMGDTLGTDAHGNAITKLDKAKEIMEYIIQHDLHPTDILDVLAFTAGSPAFVVQGQPATDANKPVWIHKIQGLQADGGTDPTMAMQWVSARHLQQCGIFLFTDGEFDAVQQKPTCRAAVFATGGAPNLAALDPIADPYMVGADFDPARIQIPYFTPRKRNTYWTPGTFPPLSSGEVSTLVGALPVPSMPLDGTAVTHPRDDADLIALRPKLIDPVLAYRSSGPGAAGYVGTVTTGIPPSWLQRADARAALQRWIAVLAPYAARDRYGIAVHDDGATLSLQVSVLPVDGRLPRVTGLEMAVEDASGQSTPLPVVPDPDAVATFDAQATLPRDTAAHEETLVLGESGPDALPRAQPIPIVIPPGGDITPALTREAYSAGSDLHVLAALAAAGGGRVLDAEAEGAAHNGDALLGSQDMHQRDQPLWPTVLVAAALAYLAAIALARWRA